MMREFMAQDDIAPLAMEGVLLEMLAESARASDELHGSNAPNWLRRVRESLEDSYLEAPGLAALAAIADVHPVHLSREFHKHYRMTIGEYIRKRRIEHASELLSNSELPMAEIAQHLRVFRSKPLLRALQEALGHDAGEVSQFVGRAAAAWPGPKPTRLGPACL